MMGKENDLVRLGRTDSGRFYVEYPQDNDGKQWIMTGLDPARANIERRLKLPEVSKTRLDDRLKREKANALALIESHEESLEALRKTMDDLDLALENIDRTQELTEKNRKWRQLLTDDIINKMSPGYEHPFIKLGYAPKQACIALHKDRDESGVLGDSFMDYSISLYWGEKPDEA